MVKILSVEQAFERAAKEDCLFIDTRTPKEFAEDHLPAAINLPILSNEERAVVGTLYKQVSRDDAIQQGIEFFSPKLPEFLKTLSAHKEKTLIVNCWRGGMRSRSVVALLDALKFNVYQLQGGYKAYRAFIREKLESFKLTTPLLMLCGLTGTGKTEILTQLENSLDLEGLAGHRGSLFGAVGIEPKSQKYFESHLYWKLVELQELYNSQKINHIVVEGESRRIGDCIIPEFLFKAMSASQKILITREIPLRVDALYQEYFGKQQDNKQLVAQLQEIVRSLRPHSMGKKRKEELCQLLEEGKIKEAIEKVLVEYYDPLYSHGLEKLNFSATIENNDLKNTVNQLQKL